MASKNGATVRQSASGRSDMTGDDLIQNTQVIGTTAELVTFGEISGVPQKVLIQNLDSTNYVEIGGDSGLTVFKLQINAGEAALVRLSSATLYAKANTAAVRVLVVAAEA